jgi:hypothetical protein
VCGGHAVRAKLTLAPREAEQTKSKTTGQTGQTRGANRKLKTRKQSIFRASDDICLLFCLFVFYGLFCLFGLFLFWF